MNQKLKSIIKVLADLASKTGLFQDKIGKALLDEKNDAFAMIIEAFKEKPVYQSENLWQTYLLHQFCRSNLPVHRLMARDIKIPDMIKKSYVEEIFSQFIILYNNFTFSQEKISQPSIPYLKDRSQLHKILIKGNTEQAYKQLEKYFSVAGSGLLSDYYYYEWDKRLKGIADYLPRNINEIEGYESQKQALLDNTRRFMSKKSFNHVFLYGSRGTGKTSLIKALLEEYKDYGLRLIKVHRDNIEFLPFLYRKLKYRKEKFIINLDDISYEENESIYKKHKLCLDSFFDLAPKNMALYATSNSQEIVKYYRQENTDLIVIDSRLEQEKKLELPHKQQYDERRAFTERFGLMLFFGKMDDGVILKLLKANADKYNIKKDLQVLKKEFDRWCIYHGTPNGRTVESFIRQYSEKV